MQKEDPETKISRRDNILGCNFLQGSFCNLYDDECDEHPTCNGVDDDNEGWKVLKDD